MSLRKILVIGVGSFGGFLCKHLSELEYVDQLYFVDHDLVESKNTRNSIYTMSQVGEYKVDALTEIIQDDVSVLGFKNRYIEGKTKLPNVDLVIDCRDIVCDRGKHIDIKLFISGKVLVIDCRKNVKIRHEYKGSYSINLTKNEISRAAFFASQIINSKQLKKMRKNKLIQTVDLNLIPVAINKSIKESLENKSDLLYEVLEESDRIHGLEEHITPIMKLSRENDIKVIVADKKHQDFKIPEFNEIRYPIIPKGSLNTSTDLIESLTDLVKQSSDTMNFIVTIKEESDGSKYIELLEETGGS